MLDSKLIFYGNIAKIGQQVQRLLTKISSDKIHFVLYDDFKSSTESEYITKYIRGRMRKLCPKGMNLGNHDARQHGLVVLSWHEKCFLKEYTM